MSQTTETPTVLAFRTQLEAVDYLTAQGFKVSASSFNRAVKAREVVANASGLFEAPALLAYAAVRLQPVAKAQDRQGALASAKKLDADAELKAVQAARQRLKLEREQGMLMSRQQHDEDLATRALFFKTEVENYIHLYGPDMIALVGGDESKLQDLIVHWMKTTRVWMSAWDSDREFVVQDEETGADGEDDDDA